MDISLESFRYHTPIRWHRVRISRDRCALRPKPVSDTLRNVESVSRKPKSARDPRIDFLRGLALITIFIDHVPANPFNLLTMRNFGFADAAELFVVLAGISSMLAYGSGFERKGARSGL
jgi:hypothetical protein